MRTLLHTVAYPRVSMNDLFIYLFMNDFILRRTFDLYRSFGLSFTKSDYLYVFGLLIFTLRIVLIH